MAAMGRQVSYSNRPKSTGVTVGLGGKPAVNPYASSMGGYGQPLGSPTNSTQPVNNPIYSTGGTGGTGGTTGGGGTTGASGTNGSIYKSADADYIRNLPTAYTPEQVLLMKNNARNQATGASKDNETKIREMMAQQGYGGSGYEVGNVVGDMTRNQGALGSTLAGIDINAANTDMANRYAKGGLINQLMGTGLDENKLGENARQFDTSQYNDMYKWSNESDYQRYLDRLSKSSYDQQLKLLLQQLGLNP